jgi:hypothetical protein
MSAENQNRRTLQVIAVLLFGNLCAQLYTTFIPPAHASGPMEVKIVDISSSIYNPLPISLEDVGSLSSDKIPVSVKEWNTYDEVKVKVTDWSTSDTVNVRTQ